MEAENTELSEEEIRAKLAPSPLSSNKFVAFFQKIWRWWQGVWYGFSERHVTLARLIYQVFFFIVFSMGVTIWQYIVMTVLPYAFVALADVAFVWPAVNFTIGGTELTYAIFNEPVVYASDGVTALATGGLGNFIAYEIAVFTAQCINMPLQRNITFRSHGNPVWQAMWYFIGWVGVSFFTSALWGIVVPFVRDLWGWPAAVYNIIKTVITGGVSMVIFFFIFLIIFPDVNKTEKSKKKKLDAADAKLAAAKGTDKEAAAQKAYDKALLAYTIAVENKKRYDSEKAISSAKSLAESKINAYNEMVKELAKKNDELNAAKDKGTDSEEIELAEVAVAEAEAAVARIRDQALEKVNERDEIVPREQAVLDEIKAAREKRAEEKAAVKRV